MGQKKGKGQPQQSMSANGAPEPAPCAETQGQPAVRYKIHPAIGIARLGNSPEGYFIGPEVPGVFQFPPGGYKDGGDPQRGIPPRIKRQAARFRIFRYVDGQAPQELQPDRGVRITWTVHLANRKAAGPRFTGGAGERLPERRYGRPVRAAHQATVGFPESPGPLRNKDVVRERERLILDPGERSVTGSGQRAEFTGGKFFDLEVSLGEIRTDAKQRLLVLGGHGSAGTAEPGRRITHYANNDRWYDDVSDGTVKARIEFRDGSGPVEVEPAWVIVAPPDYAPGISHFVTLYDVLYDMAASQGWLALPARPSFRRHVYPVLSRVRALQWVSREALRGHGPPGGAGAPSTSRPRIPSHRLFRLLSTLPGEAAGAEQARKAREAFFARVRNPVLVEKFRLGTSSPAEEREAVAQATGRWMPPLGGDDGDPEEGKPGTWFTLTEAQYRMLEAWRDGRFEPDWGELPFAPRRALEDLASGLKPPGPPAGSERPVTAEGLDRAALEACAGGPFYPGIEAGWFLRNPELFLGKDDPFRLDQQSEVVKTHDGQSRKLRPGDVTEQLACPWQADFYECNTHWWPAQRPDDVLTRRLLQRVHELHAQFWRSHHALLGRFFKRALRARSLDVARHGPFHWVPWTARRNRRWLRSGKRAGAVRVRRPGAGPMERPGLLEQRKALRRQLSEAHGQRIPWARGLTEPRLRSEERHVRYLGDERMVQDWHHLGFVAPVQPGAATTGRPVHAEVDRTPSVCNMAEAYHRLVNIEDHPDFLSRAHQLATEFLARANFSAAPLYSEFHYSPEALDERLWSIYDAYVQILNKPHYADSGRVPFRVVGKDLDGEPTVEARVYEAGRFSDRAVIESLRQRAPFNLLDGAWLQNILSSGPASEIQARLFAIWADEAGNGEAELNHCNMYETLLRSLNLYLPPVTAQEFIEQDFVPSAFDNAVFQMCVGLFPQAFLPELLGMTLYLEWESTPGLMPGVRMLEGRRIDAQFYRMHVGIDNPTSGHGHLAREAVRLYLADKMEEGGDRAVQEHWKRIWRGYVAWATQGGFGREMIERMMVVDRKQVDIASPRLSFESFRPGPREKAPAELDGLVVELKTCRSPAALEVRRRLSRVVQKKLDNASDGKDEELQRAVLAELNALLERPDLWRVLRSLLEPEAAKRDEQEYGQTLAQGFAGKPAGWDLLELNRRLLSVALPGLVPPKRRRWFPDLAWHARQRMIELLRRKARAAGPMHAGRRLAGEPLDRLFERPEALLEALARSGWIDPEHPRESRFLELLEFSGPMYKVFTEDEKDIVLDWIESLRPAAGKASPPAADAPPRPVLQRLVELIESHRALGSVRHGGLTLPDAQGTPRPIGDWFADPKGFLEALKRGGWIVPNSLEHSMFLSLIQPGGPMAGRPFQATDVELVREWILAGAPTEEPQAAPQPEVEGGDGAEAQGASGAPPEQPLRAPDRTLSLSFAVQRPLIGMGCVH